MADEGQLERLKREGVLSWNTWRHTNPETAIDLSGTDLSGIDLSGANLMNADLYGAEMNWTNLMGSNLTGADLSVASLNGADLSGANLTGANLTLAHLAMAEFIGADLSEADLSGANLNLGNLSGADLSGADLTGADLTQASLVRTFLAGTILNGCRVYGISVWDVNLDSAEQSDLIVTPEGQPEITVDNLRLAQFIYMLLANAGLRDVVDTVGRKAVLILGRFTPRRRAVLDSLRARLRELDYVPIMFDFRKPDRRTYRDTVAILSRMSRFVIADITSAKVILQEIETVVAQMASVPVQPILQVPARSDAIEEDFGGYGTLLPSVHYRNAKHLVACLEDTMLRPVEDRIKDLQSPVLLAP